jgi:hypothetical protein
MFKTLVLTLASVTISNALAASNACDQYINSQASKDLKGFDESYESKYMGAIAAQNEFGANAAQNALSGKGTPGSGVSNAAGAQGVKACSDHAERLYDNARKACEAQGPSSTKGVEDFKKIIAQIKERGEKCGAAAAQSGATSASNQQIDQFAQQTQGGGSTAGSAGDTTSGGTEKQGALSKVGGSLKKNATPLIVGGLAGLGAYAMMGGGEEDNSAAIAAAIKKKKDKDKDDDDDDDTTDDSTDLVKDAPTDTLTQSEQLTKIPTEQSTPVTSTANSTVNDPAYTGNGSDQGDTSGGRDNGVGEFLTSFGCLASESEAQCRERYACTADESMSTCQSRWESGVVGYK